MIRSNSLSTKVPEFFTSHYTFWIGIQQAPAIGRAIAELIYDDDFQTIDLTRFCFDRMVNDIKMSEAAIV